MRFAAGNFTWCETGCGLIAHAGRRNRPVTNRAVRGRETRIADDFWLVGLSAPLRARRKPPRIRLRTEIKAHPKRAPRESTKKLNIYSISLRSRSPACRHRHHPYKGRRILFRLVFTDCNRVNASENCDTIHHNCQLFQKQNVFFFVLFWK